MITGFARVDISVGTGEWPHPCIRNRYAAERVGWPLPAQHIQQVSFELRNRSHLHTTWRTGRSETIYAKYFVTVNIVLTTTIFGLDFVIQPL